VARFIARKWKASFVFAFAFVKVQYYTGETMVTNQIVTLFMDEDDDDDGFP
jgi:hypothetical protein